MSLEVNNVKINIKLKSFPILFDDILDNIQKDKRYTNNFTRIGIGSEAEIFKLPNGNALRVSQDPCSKDILSYFYKTMNKHYPQVFNHKHIKTKYNQDLFICEMENLVKLSKEEKELLKPIEEYFKQIWTQKKKVDKPSFTDKSLNTLVDACYSVYTEFKDSKYRNDMFTRNFMKRPKTNTFVVVDPICLKSFIRI